MTVNEMEDAIREYCNTLGDDGENTVPPDLMKPCPVDDESCYHADCRMANALLQILDRRRGRRDRTGTRLVSVDDLIIAAYVALNLEREVRITESKCLT